MFECYVNVSYKQMLHELCTCMHMCVEPRGQPELSVWGCLDALQYMFGNMENVVDLLCRFWTTMQKEGNRLLNYLL